MVSRLKQPPVILTRLPIELILLSQWLVIFVESINLLVCLCDWDDNGGVVRQVHGFSICCTQNQFTAV